MDAAWIFTSLSLDECRKIAESCDLRARACVQDEVEGPWVDLYEGADEEDAFPVIHGGWEPPFAKQLKATGKYYGSVPGDDVMKRLVGCRAGIEVPLPSGKKVTPLEVSILRYVLERVGEGIFDWGDRKPELSEKALASLEGKPGRPDFERPESVAPKKDEANEAIDDARSLLNFLVEENHVELDVSSVDVVAKRFAPVLTEDEDVETRAENAYAWLLDQAEIDEVFFTEEEFAKILEAW